MSYRTSYIPYPSSLIDSSEFDLGKDIRLANFVDLPAWQIPSWRCPLILEENFVLKGLRSSIHKPLAPNNLVVAGLPLLDDSVSRAPWLFEVGGGSSILSKDQPM